MVTNRRGGARTKKFTEDIEQIKENIAAVSINEITINDRGNLEAASIALNKQITALDPIRYPNSVFNPADAEYFGAFAAIALVGQILEPLKSVAVDKMYGTGVYALYYSGTHEDYSPISDTETPIYVGKADPKPGARTPRDQGTGLTTRLTKHLGNIELAENLSINDFKCRRLVVASGWQIAAESALIGFFKPIWNKETKIVQGFGKNGDDSNTRANKRSPWDTLHPGRKWAASSAQDAKSIGDIKSEIANHFKLHPPFLDSNEIIKELISKVGVDNA
ncbi:Eco29kI family restriction endonuclease [Nocardia sp. NPDC056100]|uniref:Eco29kI family restriction endonuclease n=1 Tax=Nocardia sp. NPDC056100 TaxID=3345712 RepID=UPI0035D9FA27